MSFHRLALLSTALLVPACLADDEPSSLPLGEPADVERCLGCDWGPPVTNTHGLNGLSVSALDTTGAMYDGWRLVSVEVPRDGGFIEVFGVTAKSGELFGIDAGNVEVGGADFLGSRWTVELDATSEIVVMHVIDYVPDPSATRYTFVGGYTPGNDRGFTCAQDPESGEYSVVLFDELDVDPVSGTHFTRASTLYFGCVSGAVGKAALWGYSPWASDAEGHQTATRAVRADFCGDGTAYTIQGTPLQLEDVFDIHRFAETEKDTEAMWGPDGAECIKVPRLGQDPSTITCGGATLPYCSVGDTLEDWPDALLWTKVWL